MYGHVERTVLDHISKEEVIELLRELVRTPSVNPPGEEKEISELVFHKLGSIGMEVQTISAEPDRPNVIATLRGSGGGPVLILNTHMDTVPPGAAEDWTFDPFSAELRDGKIYGRGACDNKGSLAAMIAAAEALKKADLTLFGDLVLTAVVDEEMGGEKGTKYLVDEGLVKGDMAVACGVSNLDTIYVASRGGIQLEIVTRGKTSHAAMPHLGINAVEKMAKVILAIKKLRLKHKPHRLLGSPTIAPGTIIEGGIKVNVIPDKCKSLSDIRTVPGQSFEHVLDQINECLNSLRQSDEELQYELRVLHTTEPAEISENEQIVQVVKDVTKYVTKKEPKIAGIPGATDARFLINQAGIPTVVNFGPGTLDQCHVANEHIEVDQVLAAARIYALTALQICGWKRR